MMYPSHPLSPFNSLGPFWMGRNITRSQGTIPLDSGVESIIALGFILGGLAILVGFIILTAPIQKKRGKSKYMKKGKNEIRVYLYDNEFH